MTRPIRAGDRVKLTTPAQVIELKRAPSLDDFIKNRVATLTEYQDALQAYRNSYDAIGRYLKADGELRALLWQHGPALIELAGMSRVST